MKLKPKVRITEELLQSPLSTWFDDDARLLNFLVRGGIRTLEDLLYSCGRTYPCRLCPDNKDCDRQKLTRLPQVGDGTVKRILARLVEVGILVEVKEGTNNDDQP